MGNYSCLSKDKLLEKGIQHFPKKDKAWLSFDPFSGSTRYINFVRDFCMGQIASAKYHYNTTPPQPPYR